VILGVASDSAWCRPDGAIGSDLADGERIDSVSGGLEAGTPDGLTLRFTRQTIERRVDYSYARLMATNFVNTPTHR
jgi:hypothetical protein